MDPLHYPTVLNAYLHGGVVERDDVCVKGLSAPVYYVDDESWGSAGQGLAFSHIILNRAHLIDEPEFVHDYVFLHEFGHKRWSWPLQVFFTFGQVSYVLLLILFIIASPWIVFEAVFLTTAGSTLAALVGATIAFVLIIAVPLAVTWFDEGYAEIHAVSHIGHSTYLKIQNIRQNKSRSIPSRLRSLVMYPPTSLILAISRRRENGA